MIARTLTLPGNSLRYPQVTIPRPGTWMTIYEGEDTEAGVSFAREPVHGVLVDVVPRCRSRAARKRQQPDGLTFHLRTFEGCCNVTVSLDPAHMAGVLAVELPRA
jgi:hypothetical protein